MTNSENFTFKSFIVFTLMSRKDFIYKQKRQQKSILCDRFNSKTAKFGSE